MTMVTTAINNFKSFEHPFDQDGYDFFICRWLSILLAELVCPFCSAAGGKGHFICWGFHRRHVSTGYETRTSVRIKRIRCTCCGHTHIILPEDLVPYSPIPAELQRQLIQCRLNDDTESYQELINRYIDRKEANRIHWRFLKEWEKRLREAQASVMDTLRDITQKCVLAFHQQFMQMSPTPVLYFRNLIS